MHATVISLSSGACVGKNLGSLNRQDTIERKFLSACILGFMKKLTYFVYMLQ